MDENKRWYASRTLWINAIAGLAAISGALGLDLGLSSETQIALVGGIMAVINIVLRFVTSKPVG